MPGKRPGMCRWPPSFVAFAAPLERLDKQVPAIRLSELFTDRRLLRAARWTEGQHSCNRPSTPAEADLRCEPFFASL